MMSVKGLKGELKGGVLRQQAVSLRMQLGKHPTDASLRLRLRLVVAFVEAVKV